MRMTESPFFSDGHRALAREVDAFLHQHVLPHQHAESDDDARQLLRAQASAGLLRFCVPAAAGGRVVETRATLDVRAMAVIRDTLAYGSGLADLVFIMQALGAGPISLAGSQAQRDAWLPLVAEGKAIAAFALTEPEAGSDVAAISTRAVRDGDHYVLNGQKKFISQATLADFFCVFARTADTGGKGLTALVVRKDSPGLTVRPQKPMAPHPLGEVHFHDVRVPVADRLGDEGEGMRIALRTLDHCRPTVAAAACGMARRALDESLTRTSTRKQFGKALSEQQLVQEKLARMATELAAAQLLTARACATLDAGMPATLVVSQAKLYATESAQRIIDDGVQLHGGDGVVQGSAVERLYREIRALRIYEGTSEIQHLVIARELLKG
ncbi:MAG: acyl-CoA dehydrogenase family protein [Myxococcota bacterium]